MFISLFSGDYTKIMLSFQAIGGVGNLPRQVLFQLVQRGGQQVGDSLRASLLRVHLAQRRRFWGNVDRQTEREMLRC